MGCWLVHLVPLVITNFRMRAATQTLVRFSTNALHHGASKHLPIHPLPPSANYTYKAPQKMSQEKLRFLTLDQIQKVRPLLILSWRLLIHNTPTFPSQPQVS